LRAGLE